MHLKYRNINDAFRGLVHGFARPKETSRSWGGSEDAPHFPVVERSSRNGPVLMIDEPVIVTYEQPCERVLFNQARDANPFFHLYEALWMLAGRNDVAPLTYYASNIRNYTDDGKTFNGAYGYRWRHAKIGECVDYSGIGEIPGDIRDDQLKLLIEHLKAKPDSRRAVLNMWNVEDDLLKIDSSKDVCCNLSALFSIRHESYEGPEGQSADFEYLDMTVFNRSNDLIWGMLGANVVHFSVLQEYMAAHLGVEVGVYNQVSNNLHVYLNEHWKPEEFLADPIHDMYGYGVTAETGYSVDFKKTPPISTLFPLVKDPAVFDKEVVEFVELNKNEEEVTSGQCWQEPFLHDVAQPMMHAFHLHKQRDYEAALDWASCVKASDWQYAATAWIEKRKANWEKKGVISE